MTHSLTRRHLLGAAAVAGATSLLLETLPAAASNSAPENSQERKMMKSVTFNSGNFRLAANLYIPDNLGPGRHPAIVVSHPASGVKEQTAGIYARSLAEQGFITLAFDAAYNGESTGEPHGLEDPGQRVEDIKNAITFMTLQDQVDPERIGLLGVCASGGHVIAATATDLRIKAVAGLSPAEVSRFFRLGYDGKQDPSVFKNMLANAGKARSAQGRGESFQTFPVFPPTEADARKLGQYVYEGWEYYATPRGSHPRSVKNMPWMSIDKIAEADGWRFIDAVAPRPLLFVVGTKAHTKWMAEEIFPTAKEPKEMHWIEGATHVDLYDKPQYVSPAVSKLTDFYRANLTA